MIRGTGLVAALLIALTATVSQAQQTGGVKVVVSILPQQNFVERIGGQRVTVDVLIPPGQNHETYQPTPRQLAQLAEANVYFAVGVPIEAALLPKIAASAPALRIVDTCKGITLRSMAEGHTGDAEAGHPEGKDPHVWLSPRLVMIQARTICDALASIDPASKSAFEVNLQSFLNDLKDADQRIAATLNPVRGRAFLVFHPAWGYFADAYGLTQQAIEVEGKSPSARQLARLVDAAKEHGTKTVFYEPQFDQKTPKTVAESIGGTAVAIDPLAKDYVANLLEVAGLIRTALIAQKN